jgi:hypothetical protein
MTVPNILVLQCANSGSMVIEHWDLSRSTDGAPGGKVDHTRAGCEEVIGKCKEEGVSATSLGHAH